MNHGAAFWTLCRRRRSSPLTPRVPRDVDIFHTNVTTSHHLTIKLKLESVVFWGSKFGGCGVRRGSWKWFGHLKRKGVDNWVLACRNVVVAGVRCVGRGRKTWGEYVKDNMKLLGLHPEWHWAVFRDVCGGFIQGANV